MALLGGPRPSEMATALLEGPDLLVTIRVLVITIARFERWTCPTHFSFDLVGKHNVVC